LLATLRGDYDVPVTTIGGKFNVLAIMFFIVVVIATYTANLASFFTLQGGRKGIDTLDDAILAGWRFCIVRSHLEQAKTKFPQLKDSFFVIDPVELGGDGLPGFACDNCDARTRVLQQVDPVKAKRDDSYCHAALTHLTNLEKAQEVGDHCNLKGVDELFGTLWGFPVSAKYSREVTSLVLKLQNEGRFHKLLETNRPLSRCKLSDSSNSELSAISISDLTGIWVVTFGFATIGILFTLLGKGTRTIQHYRKNKMMTSEANHQQSTKTKVDATKDEHATEIFGLNTFENTDLTGTEVSMRP